MKGMIKDRIVGHHRTKGNGHVLLWIVLLLNIVFSIFNAAGLYYLKNELKKFKHDATVSMDIINNIFFQSISIDPKTYKEVEAMTEDEYKRYEKGI